MPHQTFAKLVTTLNTHQNCNLDFVASRLQIEKIELEALISNFLEIGAPLSLVNQNEIQLTNDINLICSVAVQKKLSPLTRDNIDILPPFLTIDSTNQYLKKTKAEFTGKWRLCLSEHQSIGRGRQGKKWISPFASNVYMSLHCQIAIPLLQIGGVSLMVGLSVIKALRGFGVKGLKIKWPNDIYWKGKKLAGILIESTKLTDGCAELILGIGVNNAMPKEYGKDIDQQWVDLSFILNRKVSRNSLIAEIVNHLVENIKIYEQSDLDSVLREWTEIDYLFNKNISVKSVNGSELFGIAVGINARGELLCKNSQNEEIAIHAGDVSVRQVNHATTN